MLSQQFQSLLSRKEFSDSSELLINSYRIACELGGLKEQDFTRDPEVSYNPRPARISFILSRECQCQCPTTLAAALLCSVQEAPYEQVIRLAERENIPVEVLGLVKQIYTTPLPEESEAQSNTLIRVSLHLDRIRHLHLSPRFEETEFLAEMFSKTEYFIELARREKLPLVDKLSHWLQRTRRQSKIVATQERQRDLA